MKKFMLVILGIYAVCFSFSCKKRNTDDCPYCPKIDAIYPASGKKGDTILINGKNFSNVLHENIVTFNGTTVSSAGMIDGNSTQLKVLVPAKCGTGSVEVRLDDELYSENGPLFTYNQDAKVTVYAGSSAGTAGNTAGGNKFLNTLFKNPTQVAVDAQNNVFVMDVGNHQVVKLDANTGLNVVLSDATSKLAEPTAIAVDENNILYVSAYISSIQSNQIYKFTPGSTSPGLFATDFDLQQRHVSIACEGGGKFYIGRVYYAVSSYTPNIVHFSTAKGFEMFTKERGYAVAYNNGTVYQLHYLIGTSIAKSQFSKYAVSDTIEKILIDENAGLNAPNGLVLDDAGNAYIADSNNNRIVKYSTSGVVTTVVATGLDQPQGLAIDKQGNLYVADAGNNNIKKITFD